MWFRSNDHDPQNGHGLQETLKNPVPNSTSIPAARHSSVSQAAQSLFDLSYSMYVTENYVESYAYPLIVHLHEGYRSEQDLWKWFPEISDQNYLGLGVRAPFPHPQGQPGQYEWKLRRPDASFGAIRDAVHAFQFDWTVHPKRTYLFGEGDGAIVALQNLILQQSLEFDSIFATGIICHSLPKYWTEWLPQLDQQLSGRVLLLDPVLDADEYAAIDALSESGLEMTTVPSSKQASQAEIINHWIMAGINSAVY